MVSKEGKISVRLSLHEWILLVTAMVSLIAFYWNGSNAISNRLTALETKVDLLLGNRFKPIEDRVAGRHGFNEFKAAE